MQWFQLRGGEGYRLPSSPGFSDPHRFEKDRILVIFIEKCRFLAFSLTK
jgi:hypothetical protein